MVARMATTEQTLDLFTAATAKPGLFALAFLRDADLSAPQSRKFVLRFLLELIYDKLAVEDVTVADPTALSPTKGQQWIVATGGAGAWNTHDGELAIWDGAAWVFAVPSEGWRFYSKAQDQVYVFDSANWIVDRRLPALADTGDRLRIDSAGTAIEWATGPKAGTDTILNTNASVSVSFATAFPDANYAVGLTPDGDENVWITNKVAGGFDINRLGTSGARAVDWIARPYEDL